MTPIQLTQARAHVAVLRGLYGDMAENLDDRAHCKELWEQIEDQQRQLAELTERAAVVA